MVIQGNIVICTDLSLAIVAPPSVKLDKPSAISGAVTSNEKNRDFTVRWSASAGRFEDQTSAQTKFTCTEAGLQTLTLLVVDGDECSGALAVAVSCTE